MTIFIPKLPLSERAMFYAIQAHENCNHRYDGFNYCVHLQGAYSYAIKYIHLIPEGNRELVLASIWGHDVMEEPHETYNDVVKILGKEVADIIYALTDEKGHDRSERHNDKYFEGIRNTLYAIFGKLCDRLTNAKYSRSLEGASATKDSMFKKYRREQQQFMLRLYDRTYQDMFDELNEILNCDLTTGVPNKDIL